LTEVIGKPESDITGGICPGNKIWTSSLERFFKEVNNCLLFPDGKSVLPKEPSGNTVSPLTNICASGSQSEVDPSV